MAVVVPVTDVDGAQPISTYYDLTANLALTTTTTTGATSTSAEWKAHVHLRPPRDAQTGELAEGVKEEDDKWFEMQDLVVREIEKDLVPLGETYIQVSPSQEMPPGFFLLTSFLRVDMGATDSDGQVGRPRPRRRAAAQKERRGRCAQTPGSG